jgi:hypothetical protein
VNVPEFDCSREVVVPAAPEAVWKAVATTEGNAGWLFPNPIDPDGVGARAWAPPTQFAIRQEQGDWYNDLEFVIEDRGDGTSTVRYAHCGVFPAEGFEIQNEAIQQHTDFYLHTLGEYLQHFSGRQATYIGDVPGGIQGPAGSATPDGLSRLQRALGLDEHVRQGDEVRLTPDGVESIEGVVDYVTANFMGVRTADALYCFFGRGAFGGPVAVSIHAFDGRDPEAASKGWKRYLDSTLA